MAFKKAERTALYLRCALFGPSGSGKTMTALRMAKGIAEKTGGNFAVIDTESRSASKYSDRYVFIVDDLEKKTVDHYIASMNEAAQLGYKVLVIDSLSHAWRELTEEVDRIAQNSTSKNTFSPWAKVNPKQKRFIDAILNYPGHIIATMRSSTEWVIGENRNGKTAPEKIGLKPEQGKGIEFEFDLLVELNQRHEASVTKDRTGKYQDEIIEKPGEDFGVALYDWLTRGNAPPPAAARPSAPKSKAETAPAAKAGNPVPNKQGTGGQKPSAFKEEGIKIAGEIGEILTRVSESGKVYFTEEEKEESRQIIRTTRPDEEGIKELKDFKGFLAEELAKRQAGKTVTNAA